MVSYVQNDHEGEYQSIPALIAYERVPKYTLCVNLEILARILVELLCGQAPFCKKLVRLSTKWHWMSMSIDPIFNSVREGPKIHILCEFGYSSLNPCRVIMRISIDLRTDRHTDGRTERQTDGRTERQTNWRTDGRTQATTIILGKVCRRVKIEYKSSGLVYYSFKAFVCGSFVY